MWNELAELYHERVNARLRLERLDDQIKSARRRMKRAMVEAAECGCDDWRTHHELS